MSATCRLLGPRPVDPGAAAPKWFTKAAELAETGDAGAVAAMVTLLMAMRCFAIVRRVVRGLDDDGRVLWTDYIFASVRAGNRGPKVKTADHAHDRGWPRKQVQRICELAGIPKFCAHPMRGAHATFAEEAGSTDDLVAAQLGHTNVAITHQSYTQPAAVAGAKQDRVLTVLAAGRQ